MAASNAGSSPAENLTDRELVFARIFDAPRELVFQAWTEPKHVAQWWGPRGFSTTIDEMDVRSGGEWRLVMHGPDGRDYRNHIVFVEVVKPERLVFRHEPEKGTEPGSHETTVTFAERGDKTEVTMRLLFQSAAARKYVVETYHADEGGKQTLACLEEYLPKMLGGSGSGGHTAAQFTMTRTFDAPRDLIFKAFTEEERLKRWWGPKGFTWVSSKLDLRPGGTFHYCMRAPDGQEMWGKFVYREVAPPERLAFIVSFSDAAGNITRHPMSATWPLEVLNVVTFTEQGGKTTLSVQGHPINATEEERETYESSFQQMQQGFTGTFDQLQEYLAGVAGGRS